jgi:hypothetical protein
VVRTFHVRCLGMLQLPPAVLRLLNKGGCYHD